MRKYIKCGNKLDVGSIESASDVITRCSIYTFTFREAIASKPEGYNDNFETLNHEHLTKV